MSKPSPASELSQMGFGWTASAADSRVRISALQDAVRALLAPVADSGGTTPVSSMRSGPPGSSSKTYQPFALADWTSCSGRSLRSGMMRSGTVFPLPPSALLTDAIGCGLLPTPRAEGHDAMGADLTKSLIVAQRTWMLPTPTAQKGGGSSRSGPRRDETPSLQGMARKGLLWPTPTARCCRGSSETEARIAGKCGPDLQTAVQTFLSSAARDWRSDRERSESGLAPQPPETVGTQLNPTWVEWLMAFPLGWTDLRLSATQLFR